MLFFILLIALLNLGLGFAVAVYVSQCDYGMHDDDSPREESLPFSSSPDSAGQATIFPAAMDSPPRADSAPPSPLLGPPPQASADTPLPPATDGASQEKHPNEPAVARQATETSVAGLQTPVQQYHQQLSDLNDAFRNPTPQADTSWLQNQIESLHSANQQYLECRNEAYSTFESLHNAVAEYETICERLEESMVLQTTKIQEANDLIEAYNPQGELKDACKRMLGEVGKLTDVNHQVRDALQTALAGIARQGQWLDSIPQDVRTDTLTGIPSRAGLEVHLAEWWNKDPHRVRQLSVGLVDVDHFGKVNERCGQVVGDEILRAVALLLGSDNRTGCTVARYGGQRFALLFPDTDIRAATNAVEKIRQQVEMCQFLRGEQEIRITVSGGVTEVAPKDTSESLLDRMEATVREAKRYGRNRTFAHDGKFPTPVVPPNFSLQERQISL